MKTIRQWPYLCLVGLGMAFTAGTGCQANVGGMTLPSPHYLEHPPQYFAPSPAFPLSKELASQEAAAAEAPNKGGPGGLPIP